MTRSLIFAGIALTYWSNVHGIGATLQPVFILLFLLVAVFALMQGHVQRLPLSIGEGILYGMATLSAAVALCRDIQSCMLYSVAFFLVLGLVSLLVRTVTLEDLLDIGAAVTLLLVVCTFAFEYRDIQRALHVTITKNGLYRLWPLGNHPNLGGYIFGAGSLFLARRAILTRSVLERLLMLIAIGLSWTLIVASSARASVVAVAVAAMFAIVFEVRWTKRALRIAGAVIATGFAVAGVFASTALGYLARILDLNSRTRGFASGASGRTESWHDAWVALTTDPWRLAVGGSLRSSDFAVIGFDATENSYITILLDSGLFAGTAVCLLFFLAPFKAWRLSREPLTRATRALFLLPAFFVFLLVESIFNRYLLGIGNPMSLLSLMILMSVLVRPQSAMTPVPRPDTAGDSSPSSSTPAGGFARPA